VALVANATLPNQRIVKAPLDRIVETCARAQIEPPALIIIGAVAEGDESLNWFMRRPLFGKTIVSTRDKAGNAEFARKIVDRGGTPVEFPTIAIKPLTDGSTFVQALATLANYDWVIFTSPNGVRVFFDAMAVLGKDARVFASNRLATLGAKTAESLARYGIKADFVPTVFTGRELGTQLLANVNLHDKKVLLLRSELATKDLVEVLEQGGAAVADVPLYTAVPQTGDVATLREQIEQGHVDWLTFASPSAVRNFFEQISPEPVNASSAKVASIGPVTTAQLQELGVHVDLTADEHTTDGLLDAIEQAQST
jgi:uroporphyrinogen III methyltransferase/synthase